MKKFGMMLLALSLFSVTLGCSGEEETAPAKDPVSEEGGSDDPAEKEGEAAEDEAAE